MHYYLAPSNLFKLCAYSLQTTNSRGPQGVGYWDRLKWAFFCPDTGGHLEPRHSNAPAAEVLETRTFTPFHHPTAEEIDSCKYVASWWKEFRARKQERRGAMHVVVEPNGNTATQQQQPGHHGREHLLLAEVTTAMKPIPYFDCTVEVRRISSMSTWTVSHSLPRSCTQ